ncbi:MAG TPA: hypothetical protein VKR57_10565 [Terriglobales bacterium]|nr:hypothetical protein [Terriglobales bacterium]
MNSFIRQLFVVYRRKHAGPLIRRRRGKELPLSTSQGLILVFGIATFVGLVFILMYYIWYLPIEKSMQ